MQLAAHAKDVVALTDEEKNRLQELLSDLNETEAFGASKPELEVYNSKLFFLKIGFYFSI